MKKNEYFYLLKGFGCIAMIFIHFSFPGRWGDIVKHLAFFAVPVFLMISGWFANPVFMKTDGFEDLSGEMAKIRRRRIKTVKVLIYGLAVYFLTLLLQWAGTGKIIPYIKSFFTWETLYKAIVFCTVETAIPLWYMIAMAEVYTAWLIVVKFRKKQVVLKLIPVLFVARIIILSYCEIHGLPWFRKMNFITSAFVWFLAGYWFSTANGQKWIGKIPLGLLITGMVTGMTLAVSETWGVMVISKIGVILYAGSMFMYAVRKSGLPGEVNNECHEDGMVRGSRKRNAAQIAYQHGRNAVVFIGERLSMNVYILHVPVSRVLKYILTKLSITVSPWILPIAVVLLTLLVSCLLNLVISTIQKTKSGIVKMS